MVKYGTAVIHSVRPIHRVKIVFQNARTLFSLKAVFVRTIYSSIQKVLNVFNLTNVILTGRLGAIVVPLVIVVNELELVTYQLNKSLKLEFVIPTDVSFQLTDLVAAVKAHSGLVSLVVQLESLVRGLNSTPI